MENREFYCEIPLLSLDSGIEDVFYHKCASNKKWVSLLMEWANSKEIYIKYTNLIAGMYGNYSKHDSSHSVAILEGILKVIGRERMEVMSVIDLWLLLHCAYAHDMGMPYTYKESVDMWQNAKNNTEFNAFLNDCVDSADEEACHAVNYIVGIADKISPELSESVNCENLITEFSVEWVAKVNRYCTYLMSEYCRREHAKRTRKIIEENIKQRKYVTSFNVEDRFYRFVALCSEAHGEDFAEVMKISRQEYAAYYGECHPAFIAVLLRLGDLLDIDNNRFDAILLSYYGDLQRLSEIHKKKHESITHIFYSKSKIEITSESDNEEVCRCASDWFSYLEKEVKNLIFHWASLAPECLGGCELSLPKTKVKLNGELFSARETKEFQVNKNMLIDLVIGRNLYNSKLDFVREYLQNAFDALKMKFWLEMDDEINYYLIKPSYQEEWKKHGKATVTPFCFRKEAFDRMRTDIKCEWIKDNEQSPLIRITISDRGIGVDEECIESISHIGSGWKRRTKYKNSLKTMPKWLKPTGGFGIGMQSGFMVSDKVTIKTKCPEEMGGRRVILHSSAKSGKIEQRIEEKRHIGTSVSVDIPYSWFLDESNFQFYDLYDGREFGSFFASEEIYEAIYSLLVRYIKQVASNTLFPVRVYRPGFESEEIRSVIPSEDLSYKVVEIDKQVFHVYKQANMVYIWKLQEGVFCKINASIELDKAELQWFYKGVRVWPEIKEDEDVLAKILGSVSIDIMGIDVSDCLTVDRNKFQSGFDYISLLNLFIKVYVKAIEPLKELFGVDISADELDLGKLRAVDFYRMLLIYRLIDDEELKNSILNRLKCIEENDERFLERRDLLVEYALYNGEEKFENQIMHLPYFCKLFMEKTYEKETAYYNGLVKLSNVALSKTLIKRGISRVVENKLIYAIVCGWRNQLKSIQDDSGLTLVFPETDIERSVEVKDEVFGGVIDHFGPAKIFRTNQYYPKLYVSALPFRRERKFVKELENNKKIIISPIDKANNASEVLIKKYSTVDNKEEMFVDSIISSDNFLYLLDWVYNHQFEAGCYSREEIKEEYIELIKFIYQNQVKRLVEGENKGDSDKA